MRQGFIKVAALTPKVKVADTTYNREQICMLIDEAQEKGAKILVFPELCITGYTCGDLFYQELLLREAKKELLAIAKYTERKIVWCLWDFHWSIRENCITWQQLSHREKYLDWFQRHTSRIIMNFMSADILYPA